MIRLCWKELRERRLWLLGWAVGILIVSLFVGGQSFCGEPTGGEQYIPWLLLPMLLGLAVGAGAYSSESLPERARFLFAHPVRWQQVLLVKVLLGLAVAVIVPLLAALIFRVAGPAPYRHLVTIATVLAGAWPVMSALMIGYLLGLACSPMLPGAAGGALAVALFIMLWFACMSLLESYTRNLEPVQIIAFIGVFMLAVVGGGLRLAHLGLMQPTERRLPRVLAVFLPVLVLGTCAVIWWL